MAVDEPTGSMPDIEEAAREAGLGKLEFQRGNGRPGCVVVLGVLMAAIGVVLAGLSASGLADEVLPVVGVSGMLLGILIVYIARASGSTMKEFGVLFGVAVLLAAPGAYLSTLDEDSPATLISALVMAAALVGGGAYIVRRAKTRPAPLVESLNLFAGGIVYVSPDLDGGRPVVFPWNDTTLEEAVTPGRGVVQHTVTVRRNDGYWFRWTFNLPTDARMLRRIREVMAAAQVGPLVDQMRAGETVVLGGGLQGNAEGLSALSTDMSQDQADALPWRDIKGFAFSDDSFIVKGKRFRELNVPAQDVRDIGVLQAVIDTMAKGEPAPRRSDGQDLRG